MLPKSRSMVLLILVAGCYSEQPRIEPYCGPLLSSECSGAELGPVGPDRYYVCGRAGEVVAAHEFLNSIVRCRYDPDSDAYAFYRCEGADRASAYPCGPASDSFRLLMGDGSVEEYPTPGEGECFHLEVGESIEDFGSAVRLITARRFDSEGGCSFWQLSTRAAGQCSGVWDPEIGAVVLSFNVESLSASNLIACVVQVPDGDSIPVHYQGQTRLIEHEGTVSFE